ncbi:Abi family protein [Corynebacterium casei]|uniref:Abi family protein n=1 Tax=Corynebacterium casei TaxID=160386 RepID=UPI003FD25EDE
MVSTYNKPFLDIESQLNRLRERGMIFADQERAYRELQAIGYYRLSGYWYPFRKWPEEVGGTRPSDFVEGTTLDEVLEIYRFDERLRAEVLHAISQIEVAIRFRIGHLLGRRGPFAHNDGAQLEPDWIQEKPRESNNPNCSASCEWCESDHEQWMRKQAQNESISSEAFIAHFNSHYGKPLPVWTATETMTLGHLNRLFNAMTQRDRQQIAVDFDVYQEDGNGDAHAFSSWLEHLRQTRNYCAHHARLWNRNHTAPLSAPDAVKEMNHLQGAKVTNAGAHSASRAASRVYGTLVLIAYLLARIDYSNETRNKILTLVMDFAGERPDRLESMGFPDGWENQDVWQGDYARNEELTRQAGMLRDVDLLYTSDAADALQLKESSSERRGLLNYYRKNGAALSVPGTQAHRYPSFQFDMQSGDLFPAVILINRRLLHGGQASKEDRWSALNWWTTPKGSILGDLSPRKALEKGVLTRKVIDNLLNPRDDE